MDPEIATELVNHALHLANEVEDLFEFWLDNGIVMTDNAEL